MQCLQNSIQVFDAVAVAAEDSLHLTEKWLLTMCIRVTHFKDDPPGAEIERKQRKPWGLKDKHGPPVENDLKVMRV